MSKIAELQAGTCKAIIGALICLIAFTVPALAQGPGQKKVTGRITSEAGEPVSGASIVVKNGSGGTKTESDGTFSINVPQKSNVTLVVSSVGFVSQDFYVGNKTSMDIALTADDKSLGEVVVVGYGTQKKSDLTGSISSVKGAELTQLPAQRVDQALQGRAAGVVVTNTDGSPGGNTTIRVRGTSSINGSNAALIVIDGLQGGNISALNPNDIESIEVLKDASATAIYGSQGATGVILITTKKGRKGKPLVNYSYSYGSQELIKKLDVMNALQFATVSNAFRATQNSNGTPDPIFTQDQLKKYATDPGTDWQDEVYRTGAIQNHQLSISGGSDNVNYFVSGGYLDQKGILINSGYQRYSLRANVNVNINSWSNFGLSYAGTKEKGNSPPFGEGVAIVDPLGQVTGTAPRWDATTPVYDSAGKYILQHPALYGAANSWNPVASAVEPLVENNTIRNTLNAFLEFHPLKGLTLRFSGGAILENTNNYRYLNKLTLAGAVADGAATAYSATFARYQNSNQITYDTRINKHHFNITGVVEQQVQNVKDYQFDGSHFLVDATGVNDFGGAGLVIASQPVPNSKRVLNSYIGRINYDYAGKYLLTASYRADGSSVFGANNKWGYFPSVSAAWNAVNENFVKDLNTFSDLKLRVSYGLNGNPAINPYQTLAQLASGNNYPYDGGTTTNTGYAFFNAANPNLKWESTTQTDVGIDFGFFGGRLNGTVEYYKRTTKDLLLATTLPGYTGYPSIVTNAGSIENKGFEFAVSGDPLVGAVKWNTGFNISFNRNKVLNLGENTTLPFSTTSGAGYNFSGSGRTLLNLTVGHSIGEMSGYRTLGTWKTTEATEAALYGSLPGDIRYDDVNGDHKIDKKDVQVIGRAVPKYIFGWTNRLTYKSFGLIFLVQGVEGNNIFNAGRIRMEAAGEGTSTALLRRWTPENQNTEVPAFIDAQTRNAAGLTSTVKVSPDKRWSRWVEDGSYIRMKNITLDYTFTTGLMRRINISRLRLFVTAQNLFTITQYTGYDPEVSSFNNNDARAGIDFSNYPSAKTYSFGVDLSF